MGWAKPHGTSLHRGEGGGTGGSLTQPQWEICLSSARQPGRAIKCSLDATRCRLVSPSGCLGLGAQRPHCFSPRCAWEYSWMGRVFFFSPEKCHRFLVAIWPMRIAAVPGSAKVCPKARYRPVSVLLCKAWSSRFSLGSAQVSVRVASSKNQRVFLCAWATFQDVSTATAKCYGHQCPDTRAVLRA